MRIVPVRCMAKLSLYISQICFRPAQYFACASRTTLQQHGMRASAEPSSTLPLLGAEFCAFAPNYTNT